MEFGNFLFLFFELMLVIRSSYSHVPRRYQRQSTNPQKCELPVLENGTVRPAQRGKVIRFVCHHGYDLVGAKFSSCEQGEWQNPVPICTKTGCAPVETPENGYTMIKYASIMLSCHSGHSVAGNEISFCNGEKWDRPLGVCREDQASPAMTCDFEVSDMCGWEPDPTHDFEWKRKNGYKSVQQTQTGPRHDHTTGIPLVGHFMLATFATRSPNSVARLISPLYPAAASKNACFRFYYHMYGATTDVLRIYIKPESLTMAQMLRKSKYLYMGKHGSYENAWLESIFNINEYDRDFQVIIEATTALANRSNIAIDDVALLSGRDCVIENLKSTTVIPEDDGIYFEQSCINRCEETSSHSHQCDCFYSCVDLRSCCSDYQSVCACVSIPMISKSISTTPTVSSTRITSTTSTLPPAKQFPTTLAPSTIVTAPTNQITTAIQATTNYATSSKYTTPVTTTKKTAAPTSKTFSNEITSTSRFPPAKQFPTVTTADTRPVMTNMKTEAPTSKSLSMAETISTTPTTIHMSRITSTSSTLPPAKQILTKSQPLNPVSETVTKFTASIKTTAITSAVEAIEVRFLSEESTVESIPITSTMKNTLKTTHLTDERKPKNGSDDDPVPSNVVTSTNSTATKLLSVFGIMLILAAILSVVITAFTFHKKQHSSSSKDNPHKVSVVSVWDEVDLSK